jgi:hypothetical protein
MSKLNEEYFKQKVEYYRLLFTLFFAVEAGCIAWFINNFNKTYREFLTLDVLAILGVTATLIFTNLKIRGYIKRLRE